MSASSRGLSGGLSGGLSRSLSGGSDGVASGGGAASGSASGFPPTVEHVAGDQLDGAHDRRGQQRAHQPADGTPGQHADHRRERREADGLADDDRLDHVVLEVLVEEEGTERDEAAQWALVEAERHQRQPADEPADLGHEVRHRGPGPEERRQGDAEGEGQHRHEGAVGHGHECAAGCVAAEGAVGEVGDVLRVAAALTGERPAGVVEQPRTVEEGCGGDEAGPHRTEEGVSGASQEAAEWAVLRQAIGQIVDELARRRAEVAAPQGGPDDREALEAGDRVGQIAGERGDRVDQRRHRQDGQCNQYGNEDEAEDGDPGRAPAVGQLADRG